MVIMSDEQLKKKLLKDYYKLKVKLIDEVEEDKIINILRDMDSISVLLDEYLLVYDDEYQYDYIKIKYLKYLKKINDIDDEQIKNCIDTLNINYDIFEQILLNSKTMIKEFLKIKNIKNLTPTEISKKKFYDTLFSIPFDDFNKFLFLAFNNKSIYIQNMGFNYDSTILNGNQYKIPELNKSYHFVESNIKFSYLTMYVIIHEITHSYVEQICNKDIIFNIYREVVPFYHELKLEDYLLKNNIGNADIKINSKWFLDEFKKNIKFDFKPKNYADLQNYIYTIGPILAFYFYEINKMDPEKSKFLLKIFCNNINNYEPYELLKKLDIQLDELTSGEITKRMIKFYQK